MKLIIVFTASLFMMQQCGKKNNSTTTIQEEISIEPVMLTKQESKSIGYGVGDTNCYKLEISNNSLIDIYIPCFKKSNGRVDYNSSRIICFKNKIETKQLATGGIPPIFWVKIPVKQKVEVHSMFWHGDDADSLHIYFDYLSDTLNLTKVNSVSIGLRVLR